MAAGRRAYLAIDLGAGSGRAILAVLDAGRVQLHELARFETRQVVLGETVHWDLGQITHGVQAGLRAASDWCAGNGGDLRSVAVDMWGVDFGLIGKSGLLLGLPRAYGDPCFERAMQRTLGAIGQAELYATTGTEILPFNTLFQLADLAEREPRLLEAADQLLLMPDLLSYWLSGERGCEATIASTTQMIDARTGRCADDLLRKCGLPTGLLGEPRPAGRALGHLSDALQHRAGLRRELRVVATASHDTAVAVAAAPAAADESWCYLSSGSWSLLGAELPSACLTEEARRGGFTNESGLGGVTLFHRNIPGLWAFEQLRREFGADAPGERGRFLQAARDAPPLRTVLPPVSVDFRACASTRAQMSQMAERGGEPIPADMGAFARCALESLALAYREALRQLEQVLRRRFEMIRLVGGGSRNDLLNQMTADATGRVVHAGPAEATACGNALIQAAVDDSLAGESGREDGGLGTGAIQAIRSAVAASFEVRRFEPCEPKGWGEAAERLGEAWPARSP